MQNLKFVNIYFATTIDISEKANFSSALFMHLGADRSLSGKSSTDFRLKFVRKRGGVQPVLMIFSDEFKEDVNYLKKQSNVKVRVKKKWFDMRVQGVERHTQGRLGSTLN
ncbi:MAG: hypothetical protein MI974_30845 [Chitinophagales bacterium]|nr:hypothetical protein [Chitinophagales bacterium]